ncbi:MAG: DUF423 domain-containing protein [Methylovulum sp.]|uniref:DUF423 domain-containing protein n=1 Tax=Methylovulum sp. TaxID=1916980 RepID=UPI002635F800|nr:DUF423 domain-containing protein [Methylovulum sp.]MDD2723279.1 DUF423 domain-containing protein [Methylovulum sp.]MDD5123404.1 DUF423 domain-containing protein [Methylovulum sp.]
MPSVFLFLGATCAFLGVACGAFGAHGLKTLISPELLAVYQTGVNYQMWHALGLLAIGLLRQQNPVSTLLVWSGWLMFVGILIFSGSLYLLAVLDEKALGMMTPFGGVCFLVAWLLLALSALKKTQQPSSAGPKKHSRYH